ncbi:MAG: GNAT family N-acetyltransferase [Planctomycetota bacterium]
MITIRDAIGDDLETIIRYNIELAEESEDVQLDEPTVRAGVSKLLEDGSKGRYFMAEWEGKVVGQLMTTYEWSDWRNGMFLWIQSVFVEAEFRRRGIFRSLYRHVESLAAEPGYAGIRLYVHDHNDTAKATYSGLGMVGPGYSVLETPDALRD